MGIFGRSNTVPSPTDLVMGEFDSHVRQQDDLRADVDLAMNKLNPLITKALRHLASSKANDFKSWDCAFKAKAKSNWGRTLVGVYAPSSGGVEISFIGCGYGLGNAIQERIELVYGSSGHGYTVVGGRNGEDPHRQCHVIIRRL